MPRRSREDSAATERTIREVARSQFAELGYAGTGLDLVATAAGVTRGAVYHHFGSKQGLFEAVLVDEQRSVARAVAEAAHGSGWAALEAGSLAFVRASTAPGVGRIVLLDGPSVLGWEAWRNRDRETSGQLLIDGLRELPDLAVPAEAADVLLNGAMNDAALWIARGGDAAPVEAGLLLMIRALRRA